MISLHSYHALLDFESGATIRAKQIVLPLLPDKAGKQANSPSQDGSSNGLAR
jgi:hypothetical protein